MELVSMGLIKDGLLLNCGGSAGPICYALHQGEDQQMGSGHNDNSGRGESLLRSVLPCCKTTIIAIVQLSSNGNGSIILIWTSAVTTQQVLTKGALEKNNVGLTRTESARRHNHPWRDNQVETLGHL